MKEKSHPLGSGWLVETQDQIDTDGIAEAADLYTTERDRPLTFHWKVDADVIRSLGVPWSPDRQENDALCSVLTEAIVANDANQWVSYSRAR